MRKNRKIPFRTKAIHHIDHFADICIRMKLDKYVGREIHGRKNAILQLFYNHGKMISIRIDFASRKQFQIRNLRIRRSFQFGKCFIIRMPLIQSAPAVGCTKDSSNALLIRRFQHLKRFLDIVWAVVNAGDYMHMNVADRLKRIVSLSFPNNCCFFAKFFDFTTFFQGI